LRINPLWLVGWSPQKYLAWVVPQLPPSPQTSRIVVGQ
jgi:hypothetical protein